MKSSLFVFLLVGTCVAIQAQKTDHGSQYMDAWQAFYPSKALNLGIHTAIFAYEDRSPEQIQHWISFNQEMLQSVSDSSSLYATQQPVNARLLRAQIRREVDQWESQALHQHSLMLYARLIRSAMDGPMEADYLNHGEKAGLICQRIQAAKALCNQAQGALKAEQLTDAASGLRVLQSSLAFYENTFPTRLAEEGLSIACMEHGGTFSSLMKELNKLIEFAKTTLLPRSPNSSPILGREAYARQLTLYTDSELSPEQLGQMALSEIKHVRQLIADLSAKYLQDRQTNASLPSKEEEIIQLAFSDMEADAPESGEDYLLFWQELSQAAQKFIQEKNLATLPEFQTLRIIPAPESAGPAARIGWVESAAPFAPNPITTLYLPSIPDTLPIQEQKEFWSSFNKPFNRMIVIHELFPGHYMQIKISRETPHPIRLMFPYGPYFEGWATFCERIALDAGWQKEDPLTYLAHLRKRLENANRAYTSVMVHCQGWTQEQVMEFSTGTSLLAPQFAKSLWGRLMRGPMQMTSYFLGGKQFSDLYEAEKQIQGKEFSLQDFMDTIMKAGPIPIDAFSEVFHP